jgi:hypothetical protein
MRQLRSASTAAMNSPSRRAPASAPAARVRRAEITPAGVSAAPPRDGFPSLKDSPTGASGPAPGRYADEADGGSSETKWAESRGQYGARASTGSASQQQQQQQKQQRGAATAASSQSNTLQQAYAAADEASRQNPEPFETEEYKDVYSNAVTLTGNLGMDPEVVNLQSGTSIAKLRLAFKHANGGDGWCALYHLVAQMSLWLVAMSKELQ